MSFNGISTSVVYPNNYFFGVWDFGSTGFINFFTTFISHNTSLGNGQIYFCLDDNNGMRVRGFAFYGYICPNGYYLEEFALACKPCNSNCIRCLYMKCL